MKGILPAVVILPFALADGGESFARDIQHAEPARLWLPRRRKDHGRRAL